MIEQAHDNNEGSTPPQVKDIESVPPSASPKPSPQDSFINWNFHRIISNFSVYNIKTKSIFFDLIIFCILFTTIVNATLLVYAGHLANQPLFLLDLSFWREMVSLPLGQFVWLAGCLIVSAIILVPTKRAIVKIANLAFQAPTIETDTDICTGREALIKSLEARINQSSARANSVIFIIIASLFMGVAIVIFAWKLTSYDVSAASLTTAIQSDISSFNDQISQQQYRLSDMKDPNLIEFIKAQLDYFYSRRKALTEQFDTARNKEAEAASDRFRDTGFFRSALLTRISVLIVLIYLVRILLTLYKYNVLVGSYYNARLDSARIAKEEGLGFSELVVLFDPDKITFGPEPNHPFQEFIMTWLNRKGDKDLNVPEGKASQTKRRNAKTSEAGVTAN